MFQITLIFYCDSFYHGLGLYNSPTSEPSSDPTSSPTSTLVEQPTSEQVEQPTSEPVEQPTGEPAEQPTSGPVEQPTSKPVEQPTKRPHCLVSAGGGSGFAGAPTLDSACHCDTFDYDEPGCAAQDACEWLPDSEDCTVFWRPFKGRDQDSGGRFAEADSDSWAESGDLPPTVATIFVQNIRLQNV